MRFGPLFSCLLVVSATGAQAQLRLASWNVTNYSSGRIADFGTAIYTKFEGRSLSPDLFVGQEFVSAAGVTNFLSILNTAPGSPGDWAAAPYLAGPDTNSGFFYRTTKATLVAATIIAQGSTSGTDQPRNTIRYDVRPIGYSGPTSTLAIYSIHLKAASTTTDQQRRQVEAGRIVANIATLPAGWIPVVAGDGNIQSSSQQAWQTFINSQSGGGPLLDPINTPGSWDNNGLYRFVHTQEPSTQMDSRYDVILFGRGLSDGLGLDYIGQAGVAYSTTTWNDPNHSFRCWGNDGESFNVPIRTTANTMVGPTIAQALINSVQGNGHLPVLIDMRVPGKLNLNRSRLDFGKVAVGRSISLAVDVNNAASLRTWGVNGISPLTYNFTLPSGMTLDKSPRPLYARRQPFRHLVTLTPTQAGNLSGTITISSDDPDRPSVSLPWTARAY